MTVYTYGQLENLWLNAAGGTKYATKEWASLMAAIAEAESSGNDHAYNASGASGLWQILGAVNSVDQGHLFDPATNAHEALLKLQSQGLGAWVTYTDGTYKHFLKGNVPPDTSAAGSSSSSTSDSSSSSTSSDSVSADSLGVGGLLKGAEGLLHGAATVLDYFFSMFGRGQGWRMVFMLVAGIALFASYKELGKAGVAPRLVPRKVI